MKIVFGGRLITRLSAACPFQCPLALKSITAKAALIPKADTFGKSMTTAPRAWMFSDEVSIPQTFVNEK